MKPILPLIILLTGILSWGCSKYRFNFLHEKNKWIAIQPLGDFDTLQSAFIRDEIGRFYDRKVIVLSPVMIPAGYIVSQPDGFYAADSLLHLLSSFLNDSITEIVGITHADICTMKKSAATKGQQAFYETKNIFGIAHLPGRVCLISDRRLADPEPSILQHRIKTVVLHEMGHNLGLTHCPDSSCLMSDTNGKTYMLDKNENYYCDKCKGRLN